MKLDAESLKIGGRWLGAGSGVGVPAYAFFTSYPPPLFRGISLIIAALSGAILVIVLAWNPKVMGPDHILPRIVKRGGWFLFWSLLLLIAYVLLLRFTTIPLPTDSHTRLQIGFGMVDWTLTEVGRDWKSSNPSLTTTQMIKNEAAFTQDRITILWKMWSIYVAGLVLIVLYLSAFVTWTSGFALLAKQRKISKSGP